jgi:hypothetical protein
MEIVINGGDLPQDKVREWDIKSSGESIIKF